MNDKMTNLCFTCSNKPPFIETMTKQRINTRCTSSSETGKPQIFTNRKTKTNKKMEPPSLQLFHKINKIIENTIIITCLFQ